MDYRQAARHAARKHGLDPDMFVRMIQQESSFNPNAVSPKGAGGLGQLMPETAKELGVDPSNPLQNLDGSARYLRQQMDRFGSPSLALAAYNAGPARVAKAGGIPNIAETQNYVRAILGKKEQVNMAQQTLPMAAQMQQQRSGSGLRGLGLFDYLGERSSDTGMSRAEQFASALDPLIMPELRGGEAIRKRGAQRIAQGGKNKTVEWLRNNGYPDMAAAAEANPAAAANIMSAVLSQKLKAPKDTSTSQMKNYQFWLRQGKTPEEAQALVKSGSVTTIGGTEKAWEKGMGEYGVKTFEKIQEDAANAMDIMTGTNQLTALMQDPNFESGALADQKMQYKKILEALGGDAAGVESQEAFSAVSSKLVLDSMGGSLGAGFSEGDRKFVEKMQPSLDASMPGNKLMIRMQQLVAERKMQISAFAQDYIKENGRIDQNFLGALRKWSDETPIFGAVAPAATYLD